MKRVRLIPTGDAELAGLAECLSRLFPGHDIQTIAARRAGGRRVPFGGFTSCRLSRPAIPTNLIKLVEELVRQVLPDPDREPSPEPVDLAIVIDDLELLNVDQPEIVVGEVGRAVCEVIERLRPERRPVVIEALRSRASFHLFAPMLEAWFFADPPSLARAGVPASRLPPLLRPGDPEQLETDDDCFSRDDGSDCTKMNVLNRAPGARKLKPDWLYASDVVLAAARRERHPKAYLSWLCRDPSREKCSTYGAEQGGTALRQLDWSNVLATPTWCRFARALVADIADALDEDLALLSPDGVQHPTTSRVAAPVTRILRNL